MIGKRIFSGSTFEELAGYARAVVMPDAGGDWVMVSGTTGFDYKDMTIAGSADEQTHQCFVNIAAALEQAELSLSDVVRIRVYLSDATDFAVVAPIIGQYLRAARPANTTTVAQLVDPRMKIEIEVTARGKAKS
jgi:enamine deaminase RidA (YjgF/YER057c/UK114 family)